MANSGSFLCKTTGNNDKFNLQFAWRVKSQSISGNSTVIEWDINLLNGTSSWVYGGNIKLTISGTKYTIVNGRKKLYRGTLKSGTTTLKHNNDGSRKFGVALSGSIYDSSTNMKGEYIFTLPTIARATTATLPSVLNIGTDYTISLSRKNSSFLDTVQYRVGANAWISLADKTKETKIPLILSGVNAATNEGYLNGEDKATLEVMVSTYNGSTFVASSTIKATLNSGRLKAYVTNVIVEKWTRIELQAVENITTNISYDFGTLNGVIQDNLSTSKVEWFIPKDFYLQMPNEKTKEGTLTVESFSKGEYIGVRQIPFKVSIDEIANKPTMNPNIYDVNRTTIDLTGDRNKLVKYFSNVSIKGFFGGVNGAYVVEAFVAYDGNKYFFSNFFEPETIGTVLSNKFYFYVKDSRGLVNELEIQTPFIDYLKPTAVLEVSTPTAEGSCDISCKGSFYNNNFSDTQSNNISLFYRFKAEGHEVTWQPFNSTPTNGKNEYTASHTVNGLDYRKSYTFEVKAVDRLAESLSNKVTVQAIPLFDFGQESFNFNVPITLSGTPLLEFFYPIGSFYWTDNAQFNPEQSFGGSWEKLQDVTLFAEGTKVKAGETAGEAEHTLTVDELPAHNHNNYVPNSKGSVTDYGIARTTSSVKLGLHTGFHYETTKTGGNKPFNILPPVYGAYLWHRIG